MSAPSQENRLYVAGVSWNTTDAGFKAFFSAFGKVTDALIMKEMNGRSRGFGFVTYEDSSSVDKVMSDQRELDGRRLDIKPAATKDELVASGQGPATATDKEASGLKLYVAGLGFQTSEDEFFNLFAKYGEVERAEVMKDKFTGKSRGFGFITFTSNEGLQAALSAQDQTPLALAGRNLECKPSLARGCSALKQQAPPPVVYRVGGVAVQAPRASKTKLYVAGLLFSTKEDVFKSYFEAFGKVTDIYISKKASGESRGFGFVTFSTEAEARDVLGKVHIVDGKRVDVKAATPKPEGPAMGAMTMGMGQMQMPNAYAAQQQQQQQMQQQQQPYAVQQQQQQSYGERYPVGQQGGYPVDAYGGARGGGAAAYEDDYANQGAMRGGGYGAYPTSRHTSRTAAGYHPYSR